MRTKEGEELARRVISVYEKFDRARKQTIAHFALEGESPSTLYKIIDRYNKSGQIGYGGGHGPIPSVRTPENILSIKDYCKANPNASYTDIAAQHDMSKTSAIRACKEGGVVAHVRKPAPSYIKNQAQRCMNACRGILKRTAPRFNKIILQDDESWIDANPDANAGVRYYKTVDGQPVDDAAQFKAKDNYPKKYLVWQCIAQDGKACEPYISEGTMNAKIYRLECLEKRLLPWIIENYAIENVLFWPDMATCHYAGEVVEFLTRHKIDFIKRDENAPKLPQARPIERYWALCKREYAKIKCKPQNLCEFAAEWTAIYPRILSKSGKPLWQNIRKKMRSVANFGPYEPLRTPNQRVNK